MNLLFSGSFFFYSNFILLINEKKKRGGTTECFLFQYIFPLGIKVNIDVPKLKPSGIYIACHVGLKELVVVTFVLCPIAISPVAF